MQRTLTDIYIYPVKSLGGIRMDHAYAGERGLKHDRRWMITYADNTFITQREIPIMSLVGTALHDDGIHIFLKDDPGNKIVLPFNVEGEKVKALVWKDMVEAIHYNVIADEWISDALKSPCRFIYMPDDAVRTVEAGYSLNNENVSFADAFPYLILGKLSLEDLNQRLADPLPMNRFRPNLVFSEGTAYEEDQWKDFTIGNISFRATRQCGRCPITTINQDTAEQGKEPLKTLATYRTFNNKVMFGMNVLALTQGEIKIGDTILLGSCQ